MDNISKRIGIILLVIAIPALCVVHMITPTFGRQIPFNEWAWKHYPVQKIRYYMSDSVLEWLNTDNPPKKGSWTNWDLKPIHLHRQGDP